jgi:hypothetical protein
VDETSTSLLFIENYLEVEGFPFTAVETPLPESQHMIEVRRLSPTNRRAPCQLRLWCFRNRLADLVLDEHELGQGNEYSTDGLAEEILNLLAFYRATE